MCFFSLSNSSGDLSKSSLALSTLFNLDRGDEDLQNSINQEINYEGIDHGEDDDEEDEEDDEYDDEKEHPRPCDCGQIKCLIIKTALERYSQQALELNK